MMNWILVILFVGIILKEFKIVNQLVIKQKTNYWYNIINNRYCCVILHNLCVCYYFYTLFTRIIGYSFIYSFLFQNDITSKGFVSCYRCLYFVPWNKVQEVHIKQGKSIKISYLGNGSSNKLYFKEKDYDK